MHRVNIRNIPDEVHAALRVRAAQHGRSLEAEMREILSSAAREEAGLGLGSRLQQFGREQGGLEIADVDGPVEPADFS